MPETGSDVGTIHLRGDLDIVGVEQVETDAAEALNALGPGDTLIFDLGDVDFIDSSGLAALISVRRKCARKQVDTALTRVPESIAALLTVSGLDAVLPSRPG